MKVKEVHVLNVSPLVHTIYNFVKPFVKEKIYNRVYFHTDGYESLYKYVPKDVLPEEYGGYAGPIAAINGKPNFNPRPIFKKFPAEQWMRKLEGYKDWFMEQESVKADESKRPGKPQSYDDLFGVEGSFRKLAID